MIYHILEPGDFSLVTSIVIFLPGQSTACYNQTVVNDDVPENTESFNISIIDIPANDIGDPGIAQIVIDDDDARELFLSEVSVICIYQHIVHMKYWYSTALQQMH